MCRWGSKGLAQGVVEGGPRERQHYNQPEQPLLLLASKCLKTPVAGTDHSSSWSSSGILSATPYLESILESLLRTKSVQTWCCTSQESVWFYVKNSWGFCSCLIFDNHKNAHRKQVKSVFRLQSLLCRNSEILELSSWLRFTVSALAQRWQRELQLWEHSWLT